MMKAKHNPLQKRKQKGVALIWGTLFLMVLLGFMAIMLDFGRGYLAVHQIQNAADAAALAGARFVPLVYDPTTGTINTFIAKNIAHEYAIRHVSAGDRVYLETTTTINPAMMTPVNPYDPAITDDIIIGRFNEGTGEFFVDHLNPDAMMVIARRDGTANQPLLGLMFGPAFGQDFAKYTRFAVAKVVDAYGAGMIALGEYTDRPGISFSGGNKYLTILNGGSLHVNSSYGSPENPAGNSGALDQTGNSDPVIDVSTINVVGGVDPMFDPIESASLSDYDSGVQPAPDPFESAPDAVYDTSNDLGTIFESGTYLPGYYSGGMQVTSSETVINLLPGNYYLDSPKNNTPCMLVNGGSITGTEVTLHIVGDTRHGVDMQGNGIVDISAPTSGDYQGIAIFQARDPDGDGDALNNPDSEIYGFANMNIDGAIYMPKNLLTLGGSGGSLGTQAIADRFHIQGNANITINYKSVRKVLPKSYLVK